MRRSLLLLLPALACTPFVLRSANLSETQLVKEGDRWWSHIQTIASDDMEGRNTGSAGYLKAAKFLAGEFERAGLKPGGTDGYFQPVKFKVAQIDEKQSSLAIVTPGTSKVLELGLDANMGVRAQLEGAVEAEAVFCGYGLRVPENNFDDFAGDLKGKICVLLGGGPDEIPGNLRSHYASRAERWKAAKAAGVLGYLTFANPKSMDIPWERSTLSRLNATMELAEERFSETAGMKFAATGNPGRAEQFFEHSGHTFKELLAIADSGKALPRFPLNIKLKSVTTLKLANAESPNVIGILPGTDPTLKDEFVVFGGHLDHLGIGAEVPGADPKADRLYNGAMDDGSGMATLIEIATMAKEMKLKPKRSLLFIAVCGEEKGLLGSQYFTASPTVPAKKIVAEINNDMYLPLFPLKYLQVIGLEESTLGEDIRQVAAKAGVTVQPDPQPNRNLLIRSDQYNFIRQGIPAMTFKFGWLPGTAEEKAAKNWLTERYHAPGDDLSQPVDKPAAARFNHLMLDLGMKVADTQERPRWNEKSFFKRFEKN